MELKKGIDALTSLRFFAALLVFIDHFILKAHALDWSLSLGYIAMTFFFMLSGFVLTYAYHGAFANAKTTKFKFYIGRLARIWPLHILCLVIVIPFALPAFAENFRHAFFFLIVNILLLHDFVPHSATLFNEPSWSISAEMFFYLCFPFLVTLAVKRKNIFNFILFGYLTLLAVIAFLFSANSHSSLDHNISLLGTHISLAGLFYVFPLTRLLDFMFGIFLFFSYQRFDKAAISGKICTYFEFFAILFLATMYLIHPLVPQLIQFDLLYLPAVFMMLFVFALEKGALSRLLSNRRMILLGEASFAFYMLQIPVHSLLQASLVDNLVLFQATHFIVLLVGAIIVHKYFEFPCYRKIRAYFGVKQQIARELDQDEAVFNRDLEADPNRV